LTGPNQSGPKVSAAMAYFSKELKAEPNTEEPNGY